MPRNWRSAPEINKDGPTAEDEARFAHFRQYREELNKAEAEARGMVPPGMTVPIGSFDEVAGKLFDHAHSLTKTEDFQQVARFMLAHNFSTGGCNAIGDLLLQLGEQMVTREAEIRRLRDAIVSARWRLAKGKGLWNGPATECDMVLEDALEMHDPAEAIASMTCDHDWEQVNPRIFDGQRCLRCGTWK